MISRVFFVSALFLSGVAYADFDPATSPCAECHGADGIGVKSGIPHLNAQLLEYLQEGMVQFRTARRPGRALGHDPAGIDEAQLQEVLKHYSASKAVRPKQEKVDPQQVEKGAGLYRDRCMDCHGDSGRDSDKDAPLMAAQDIDYIIKQGNMFVSGKRKFPMKMDQGYHGLSDADLEAVAHFFGSQEQFVVKKKERRRR